MRCSLIQESLGFSRGRFNKYWSWAIKLIRVWAIEREYMAVLNELTTTRGHLDTLEALYDECYHCDLIDDIVDYSVRVAALTDELERTSSRRHALKNEAH